MKELRILKISINKIKLSFAFLIEIKDVEAFVIFFQARVHEI